MPRHAAPFGDRARVSFRVMWGWITCAALVGLAGRRLLGRYPAPARPPQALARRELATLEATSNVLFPPGGAIAPSGAEASVAAYVDRLVAASQPRQRLLIRALLFLVEHGTVFFPAPGGWRGLRRFSSLDGEQQVAVIDDWQHSGWFLRRLVFTSLRALCTLGYFADPAVLRALRLAPYAIDSPIIEADLLYPRIGAHPSSIAYTAADLSPTEAAPPLDLDGALMSRFVERPAR